MLKGSRGRESTTGERRQETAECVRTLRQTQHGMSCDRSGSLQRGKAVSNAAVEGHSPSRKEVERVTGSLCLAGGMDGLHLQQSSRV